MSDREKMLRAILRDQEEKGNIYYDVDAKVWRCRL